MNYSGRRDFPWQTIPRHRFIDRAPWYFMKIIIRLPVDSLAAPCTPLSASGSKGWSAPSSSSGGRPRSRGRPRSCARGTSPAGAEWWTRNRDFCSRPSRERRYRGHEADPGRGWPSPPAVWCSPRRYLDWCGHVAAVSCRSAPPDRPSANDRIRCRSPRDKGPPRTRAGPASPPLPRTPWRRADWND